MKKELELYLHIPFCIRKCEYCDFLSGPADEKSRRVYLDAMLRELAAVGPQAKEYEVISVYIGGGTPSLLPGDWMEELMEVVRDTYCLKKDAEISMEANPGTLTAINLAGYHRAGINRLSLGCQSTDDTELKLLGRIHTWAQFQESFQMAREAGFANLNVDLMSGLPRQKLTSWEKSLEVIAGMEPLLQRKNRNFLTRRKNGGCMSGHGRFYSHMDIISMKSLIMPKKEKNAGTTWDTGHEKNIWDLVWEVHLCFKISVLPI